MAEERYFIFETQKSTDRGLHLLMSGEQILAESEEHAVKQFLLNHRDLDPSKISKAEAMEEQHYLAIPADTFKESWHGHKEKPPVHEVLGM